MPLAIKRQAWVFLNRKGSAPFLEWFCDLEDSRVQARIAARIRKMTEGSLGDIVGLGGGIWEARIHFGSGWRLYCGLDGKDILLLLVGGVKSGQDRDIQEARLNWSEYEKTKGNNHWEP